MAKLTVFAQPQPYAKTLAAMQNFTNNRTASSNDQIWLLQHQPIFTYGAHTKPSLPNTKIPISKTDRGGNITYHAPGQLIIYVMLNTKNLDYSIHGLIERLEQLTTAIANFHNITTHTINGRRGVYVKHKKLASLGLRFKKFCSYHGLALNVDLDLTPFSYIKPCGYQQQATSLLKCGAQTTIEQVANLAIDLIPKYLLIELT